VRRPRWLLVAAGAWIALEIVLLGLVPALWQRIFVNPNQLDKELTYLGYELAATRSAFNLTKISEAPYELTGDLSSKALALNKATIENIRMWDPETLQRSYKQIQQLRPYYSFTTVSVDRYRINGRYQQTMLSPRELNVFGLPATAQTWVNRHITYTHGYGVAVSAVNEVAADGSPEFLVKDVPMVSEAEVLKVDQPRIYYGLSGTDYTLVKTTNPEFDYPGKGGDVYRSYDGSGGIPISSFVNRLAFSVANGTIQFLTTNVFTDESRAIIRNDIRERLSTAAPFLSFDRNPYMVIADGRLYWIADAYTTSSRVPYSEPTGGGINYIRNSVKAVIDAFDGSVDFYIFDPEDPLIRVWNRIFPGLFRKKEDMPEALSVHVRYPVDMLLTQGLVYAKYHMTDPAVFYNQEDLWIRATEKYYNEVQPVQPYYIMWELPGANEPEFVLILPFTPKRRQVLIGWIAGMCDGEHYGRFLAYKFPKEKRVLGTQQVETKIDQDRFLSGQLSLWDQRGSNVIRGNVLAIPVEKTLFYVEPIYLQAETAAYPELRLVVVMHNDNLSYGNTFDEALAGLFKEVASEVKTEKFSVGTVEASIQELIDGANDAFNNYLDHLGNKRFEEASRALKKLQEDLEQLDRKNVKQ